MNNEIGNNIRILREVKGLTQKQMASELDMSVSGYNKIERGETDIAISRLQKIATVLNTDVSKLLSPDHNYTFHFNNNTNANGIVQNQYVTNSEEVKQMLDVIKKQMELLQQIINRK